jgi:hypothetical protein
VHLRRVDRRGQGNGPGRRPRVCVDVSGEQGGCAANRSGLRSRARGRLVQLELAGARRPAASSLGSTSLASLSSPSS